MKRAVVTNRKLDPDYDQYIGRGTPFGNPFKPDFQTGRIACIDKHRGWFMERLGTDPLFLAQVLGLRGKRLACSCKPSACHGDVIAEFVNMVEAAATPLPTGTVGGMANACSVCTALRWTQIPYRHHACMICHRWYCPAHLPAPNHACPNAPMLQF